MKSKTKLIILYLLISSRIFSMGTTQIWLEPIGGAKDTKYYIGQQLNLQVRINTYGEKITGATIYLTLDTKYLKIIPYDNDGYPVPFKRGNFFTNSPSQNGFHDDTIENPNANGIEGLQLDYFQQSPSPLEGQERPYAQGSGILAYFKVEIVGIPENENNEYILGYDDDFYNIRETGYFIKDRPGELHDYNFSIPLVLNIFGSSIDPALPDTTLTPGQNLDFYLGDHFYAKDYDIGSAIWSYEILNDVAGTSVNLDTINDRDMMYITTSTFSKGNLQLRIHLGISGTSFMDTQIWNIFINHPPNFVYPINKIILNEDIEGLVAISTLVTDQDDAAENLFFRAVGDSAVSMSKDNALLKFISKENWFGDTKLTLFATDSASPEISEEINITVLPVNDAPIIDFSNTSLLSGDTLILHHGETKKLRLNDLVYDVDDDQFTWTYDTDSKLNYTLNNQNELSLSVSDNASEFFGLIPILLTVYDPSIEYDRKILYIDVRSYSPSILPITPIMMHADSTRIINLSSYVIDNDTQFDNLTFSFQVIDTMTNNIDNNVFTNYNRQTSRLSISSVSGHSSTNYVKIFVNDPENNISESKFLLMVVETYSPRILKIPGIVVYQDSTAEFDLSPYIVDAKDDIDELDFEITGNNIFESVEILPNTAKILFDSYPEVFGSDTLQLFVENSSGLRDTANIVAYCIPNDNKPILLDISDLELDWRRKFDWIDLDDYVFDAFTPISDLVWDISQTTTNFSIDRDDNNFLTITTSSNEGSGKIILKVTNDLGYVAEKQINITVSKDQKPAWSSFQDIYLARMSPVTTLEWSIFSKCYDEETPSKDMIYSVDCDANILDVSINQESGKVSIEILNESETETWMKFSAKDQSQNEVSSPTIKVFLTNGLPPTWRTIPTIYMKNSEVYDDLRLLNYCQDIDGLESDIIFSALASNSNIDIEITEDSYVQITAKNGVYGDNFYIIFKATDSQNNIISKSVKLVISDDMAPKGYVNYVINPVISTNVDFIISTDLSVKDVSSNFKKLPSTNISLSFNEMNTSEHGKLWTDDYKFTSTGTYKLIIEMLDNNNIETTDTIVMAVDFPDNNGSQLSIGSGLETLKLEYPAMAYHNKMFFISEENLKSDYGMALSKQTLENEVYAKKYKIQSGLSPNEVLLTLRFNPIEKLDKYHSFYKIVDNEFIQLETWLSDEGEFKAYIAEDCEICFQKSAFPAKEEIVPENHFICYPNPFNPTVNMKFLLKSPQKVTMQIYNILGQKIYTEVKEFNPGINQMSWSGKNNREVIMPSGVYFVLISKNNKPMKIQKVTLFK